MDRKSKILILIFIVGVFVSIFFTYKRSFLDRDFIIFEEQSSDEEDQ